MCPGLLPALDPRDPWSQEEGSLALNQGRVVEPVLVHSGVILTMLQLLPAMHHDEVCNIAILVHFVNTNCFF